MRDLWLSMPDSLCTYLNQNLRAELVDFVDMGVKAEVKNQMNSQSVMDTLTADFTCVRLSESLDIQLKLLPAETDTLICMVRTFSAPARESFVSFYDMSWHPAPGDYGLSGVGAMNSSDTAAAALLDAFVQRPDTMGESRFQELKKLIDPVMVCAALSPSSPVITFSLSFPMATADEREQLNAIVLQRKYKWERGIFNKY